MKVFLTSTLLFLLTRLATSHPVPPSGLHEASSSTSNGPRHSSPPRIESTSTTGPSTSALDNARLLQSRQATLFTFSRHHEREAARAFESIDGQYKLLWPSTRAHAVKTAHHAVHAAKSAKDSVVGVEAVHLDHPFIDRITPLKQTGSHAIKAAGLGALTIAKAGQAAVLGPVYAQQQATKAAAHVLAIGAGGMALGGAHLLRDAATASTAVHRNCWGPMCHRVSEVAQRSKDCLSGVCEKVSHVFKKALVHGKTHENEQEGVELQSISKSPRLDFKSIGQSSH
jgi:hypothetical protein